jgi:hypothetical protein
LKTKTKSFAEIVRDDTTVRVSVDGLVELCDEADYWPSDFGEKATLRAKKAHIRKKARKVKIRLPDGTVTELISITETNPKTGRKRKVYKQLAFFETDDFVDAINDRYSRRQYNDAEIRRLLAIATQKHGREIQRMFPFVEVGPGGEITIV